MFILILLCLTLFKKQFNIFLIKEWVLKKIYKKKVFKVC